MKYILVSTLVLYTILNLSYALPQINLEKVAVPHSRPYQVSVNYGLILMCSGVILNKNSILTAGHCCRDTKFKSKEFFIIAGAHANHGPSETALHQTITITSAVIHEKFDHNAYKNNICIMKLEKDLVFNQNVQPAMLPQQGELFTGNATSSGWGSVDIGSIKVNSPLRVSTGPILSDQACLDKMDQFDVPFPMDQTVCFYSADDKGCTADLGDPLTVKDDSGNVKVIGILSGGFDCFKEYPDFYTETSHFIDWIDQHKN